MLLDLGSEVIRGAEILSTVVGGSLQTARARFLLTLDSARTDLQVQSQGPGEKRAQRGLTEVGSGRESSSVGTQVIQWGI